MPIFWRVLLINLIVVLGGAVIGTQITQRFVQRGEFTNAMHVGLVVVALGLSALVTWLGIRNAFRPLRELRRGCKVVDARGTRAHARRFGGQRGCGALGGSGVQPSHPA